MGEKNHPVFENAKGSPKRPAPKTVFVKFQRQPSKDVSTLDSRGLSSVLLMFDAFKAFDQQTICKYHAEGHIHCDKSGGLLAEILVISEELTKRKSVDGESQILVLPPSASTKLNNPGN
jgi:hypothetical protein